MFRIRTRKPGPGVLTGTSKVYYPHGYGHTGELFASPITKSISVYGSEIMNDSTHGRRPRGKLAKIVDWGGSMTRSTYRWDLSHPNISIDVPENGFTGRRTYDGYWIPVSLWTATHIAVPATSYLDAMGTKGIALASPTRPQAGLTQFIAELKELPKAPILGLYKSLASGGRKKDFIRKAKRGIGHEYLNFEFGWRPLQKDMEDFHKSAMNASKTIDQYLRDSGRPVRRKRKLVETKSQSDVSYGSANHIGAGPDTNHLVAIDRTQTITYTTLNVWFEGSFTYYISAGDNWVSEAKRNEQILSKLAGTRFGIDTLWELTPWSWALDWVANIGDVARNLAAFANDGLVLHYAYVMYHQTEVQTTTLRARSKADGSIMTTSASLHKELKMRHRATPFGFGLTLTGFSTRQLAIVAALGLSRSR